MPRSPHPSSTLRLSAVPLLIPWPFAERLVPGLPAPKQPSPPGPLFLREPQATMSGTTWWERFEKSFWGESGRESPDVFEDHAQEGKASEAPRL